MPNQSTVEEYLEQHPEWHDELVKLRSILQGTRLEETVKWGAPTYTYRGKNVVGLAAFKRYVGLWFHQGALLADERGVLINAQEGKTKALRQWRFSSLREIKVTWVRAYVAEATALAEAGRELAPAKPSKRPAAVPPELEAAFKQHPKARTAFAKLTPGRQREYADYVAAAKREATRTGRAAKVVARIESGSGLNDRYR